jgi:hypothetical protein
MQDKVQPYPETATAPSDEQRDVSPADEMIGRILTASLDKALAALPDAITAAMKKALPDLYTAELAAELAKDMSAHLRHAHQAEVTA